MSWKEPFSLVENENAIKHENNSIDTGFYDLQISRQILLVTCNCNAKDKKFHGTSSRKKFYNKNEHKNCKFP